MKTICPKANMGRVSIDVPVAGTLMLILVVAACPGLAQSPEVPFSLPPAMTSPAPPLYKLEDGLLEWPLPPGENAYAATHVINIPTFALGMEDGYAVRDLIGKAPADQPPHVKIRLTVKFEPNLKTYTVWGTLPGATDETIYVMAHRDGWFEGATDNASGVATMLGLAEYFAKIPESETPDKVPWTGLEASTRAYAKIIDEVNKLDLKDLQRPPEPAAARE
jgi:hypothetical protein